MITNKCYVIFVVFAHYIYVIIIVSSLSVIRVVYQRHSQIRKKDHRPSIFMYVPST